MRGNKKNNKKQKIKKNEIKYKEEFSERYKSFCYKLLGSRLRRSKKHENLNNQLKMANLKFTAETFLATMIVTGTILTILSIIIFFIIFNIILSIESWLLYFLVLTIITSFLSYSMFFFLMKLRISSRELQLDQELPFTLSELSVLASTGLTPIKILRHIAQRKGVNPHMINEFKKAIHKIDIEGKDIVTALGETARESPSENLREALWDLSNMIHQGGDLDEYLRQKTDQTLQLRRDVQKTFTEKLASYSEMYISLVLVGVLFIGIAAFLINAISTTMGPLDADTLLILLAYGLIPVAVTVISILISTAYSRGG